MCVRQEFCALAKARIHPEVSSCRSEESGLGTLQDGHCHLFAYVPAGFVKRLQRLQMRWLRAITGKSYKKAVIKSKPIGGLLGLETGNPALHEVNLSAAIGYVLKGAIPAAVAQFRLALVEPGGRVVGRRCSTSQNIGQGARRSHHTDMRDLRAAKCD